MFTPCFFHWSVWSLQNLKTWLSGWYSWLLLWALGKKYQTSYRKNREKFKLKFLPNVSHFCITITEKSKSMNRVNSSIYVCMFVCMYTKEFLFPRYSQTCQSFAPSIKQTNENNTLLNLIPYWRHNYPSYVGIQYLSRQGMKL